MSVTICSTAWNEEGNIPAFVGDLEQVHAAFPSVRALIVNNGSTDTSGVLLREFENQLPWMTVVDLRENKGYGGGLLHAVSCADSDFVLTLSVDGQYSPTDVITCLEALTTTADPSRTAVVGSRKTRLDGVTPKVVSRVYTSLANALLGLQAPDINGQPKIFPRDLISSPGISLSQTFVLDSQVLALLRRRKTNIIFVPVAFLNRRTGVSSWSGRRVRTYLRSVGELMRFRRTFSKNSVKETSHWTY